MNKPETINNPTQVAANAQSLDPDNSKFPFAEEEYQYRQLVESLPEAVYCCDRSGHVTLYNQAAVKLWGRRHVGTYELWCGSHKMFTVDGLALPLDQCPMAISLLQGKEIGSVEAVVERPDGVRRYVLAHPQLLRDQNGEIAGAINVVFDITDRKLMEDQLIEADKAKNIFFSMLSHELRSPMTPIANAALMIQQSSDKLAIDRMAGVIERQIKQLSRLADDLLDASRLSNGELGLQKTQTTLENIIEIATDAITAEIENRQQQLLLNIPNIPIVLFCDQARVAQIIENVLINAAKYTDNGGTIKLTAHAEAGQLYLCIEDNGIGIPADKLDAIFDLYSQIDRQAARTQGGMGIGLSLVKSLCQRHGGKVSASSDGKDKGSQFSIILPIVVSSSTTI